MRMPSEEAINTAIAWLQVNDAGDQEQRDCEHVAAYLGHMLDERYIRAAARRHGVPIARVRNRLTEQKVRKEFEATVKAEQGE